MAREVARGRAAPLRPPVMTPVRRPVHPFEVRHRDLWAIALPASVAFITEPVVGIVDLTVIGRLGETRLLGGVVLGALAFDILFALAAFLRLGTAGLTAQAVGARDPGDGLLHLVRAGLMAVGIGLVMLALAVPLEWSFRLALAPSGEVLEPFRDYFFVRLVSAPFVLVNFALLGWFYGRAAATTGMALQLLLNGVNIVLSIVFVYGLGWGVPGVAWATVLAQGIAALAGVAIVVRHYGGLGTIRAAATRAALLDLPAVRRMLGLSRDLTIRSVALMAAFAWFTAQTSRLGEVELAGSAILMHFLMISAFFLDGQAQAAEQLCGKAVGANWRPAFARSIRLAMGWGLVLSSVLFALFVFGGPVLIDVMTTVPEVRGFARDYLLVAAFAAYTGMPAFVMDGVMTGATLNTVIRNGMLAALAIYLAAALTLQPLLGLNGLWLALHMFFLARAVIFWLAVRRRMPALFPEG